MVVLVMEKYLKLKGINSISHLHGHINHQLIISIDGQRQERVAQ